MKKTSHKTSKGSVFNFHDNELHIIAKQQGSIFITTKYEFETGIKLKLNDKDLVSLQKLIQTEIDNRKK